MCILLLLAIVNSCINCRYGDRKCIPVPFPPTNIHVHIQMHTHMHTIHFLIENGNEMKSIMHESLKISTNRGWTFGRWFFYRSIYSISIFDYSLNWLKLFKGIPDKRRKKKKHLTNCSSECGKLGFDGKSSLPLRQIHQNSFRVYLRGFWYLSAYQKVDWVELNLGMWIFGV